MKSIDDGTQCRCGGRGFLSISRGTLLTAYLDRFGRVSPNGKAYKVPLAYKAAISCPDCRKESA